LVLIRVQRKKKKKKRKTFAASAEDSGIIGGRFGICCCNVADDDDDVSRCRVNKNPSCCSQSVGRWWLDGWRMEGSSETTS
jgi:hypothetical protein